MRKLSHPGLFVSGEKFIIDFILMNQIGNVLWAQFDSIKNTISVLATHSFTDQLMLRQLLPVNPYLMCYQGGSDMKGSHPEMKIYLLEKSPHIANPNKRHE